MSPLDRSRQLSYLQQVMGRSADRHRSIVTAFAASGRVLQRLLLACLLVVLACDKKGVEFVEGENITITGSLSTETNNVHLFTVSRSGTVGLSCTSLAVRLADTGEPIENPFLTVSLGRPSNESCAVTLTTFLQQGDSASIRMQTGAACLRVSRTNDTPSDALVDYTLVLSSAFD